ncbi:alpha/beta hydrolase [Silvanigrella aquatica]|uniref:Phospholipase/carboxylesterase/thioesterase domain-containing protein n=1 Tax=Silvanigrella aquatica TaxID=1915309 RepID=A0A1L4CYZ3_9BACT|nr:hypothetical protein [Silvanigrella aquatica]APJ03155.1 hypothetical protein AXG55_04240 [Silvanigrella aquatica]
MSLQRNMKWIGSKSINQLESPLKTIALCKGNNIKNVIICMHGFGDNAANFSSLGNEIKIDDVLWLFPQGPRSYPMGEDGSQWFPLFNNPTEERRVSEDSILQLLFNVTECLKLEMNKIFILGFSQGAAMSLLCGLKSKEKLAGILSLSGFLIQPHVIKNTYSGEGIETPLFIAHGNQDQVIFPATYFETIDSLKDMGCKKLRSKIYSMGHSICQEEIKDITKFLEEYR